MENVDANLQASNSISIDNEIKSYLLESAKWAKFLSILGFIGLGLMVILLVFMLITERNLFGGFDLIWMLVSYVLMLVLYFFPIHYLYKFSIGIKQGLTSNNQQLFITGLRNLKSHYKYIGIFSIVVISIYGLIFLISFLMIAIR